MNPLPDAKPPAAASDEIANLVRQLAEAEARLQDCLAGQADKLTNETGHPSLLQHAQAELVRSEVVQRRAVKMQAAILDALPAHIALVDAAGVILAVNESWRRFATADALNGPAFGVGQNYLELCDRAQGECAEEARPTAAGIRAVLSGKLPEFTLEYPCHAPDEKRWFRLMVTPLHETDLRGAAVMHVNVTERRLIGDELRDSHALTRLAGRLGQIGAWSVNLQSGSITWSEEVRAIHEVGPDFVSDVAAGLAFYAPEDRPTIEQAFAACSRDGTPYDLELQIITATGRRKWIRTIGEAVRHDTGQIVRVEGAFQDITDRKTAAEQVRESEERFRTLLQDVPSVAIQGYRVDGTVTYWNQASEAFYGYSEAEALGSNLLELIIPPELQSEVRAALAAVAGGADIPHSELRLQRKDGSRILVHSSHAVVRRRGQEPELFCIDIDLSTREAAAAAVRESEAHYRLLFAQNPHPMWVIDRETLRYIAVNQAAVRDYGYSAEEFLGMTILDLRAPNDAMSFADAVRTMPEGFIRSIRYHRKKDGTEMIVDASSDDVTFKGRPARLITAQDITERIRTESRVTQQAMLLEKVKDAILLRDLDHHILYWNQSAERLYGWSAAEALGRSVRDLLYANPEAFDAATTHVLQHGEWTGELPQNRRDGSVITVDANWTLMRDDDGQPKSILAINTDITERKKLEAQFIRSQRLESIGTLAGGIAHDLNNLLAPIVMGAGLMRQLNPPDNTKKILQTIEDSAKRGATLIKQVLSFARGVEGERVTIDLAELGTEIENIIVNTFPRNIIFKSELPTDLWPVVGDPTQLHQVLINLCVNARDAMPGGGRLSLTARNAEIDEQFAAMDRDVHPGRYVVLEVKDDGTGMPPEVIDRIFDPFYTTKDLGQGTGLGLSTLLGIVRSHGGFVNVSSQVGRGSAFQVHLPVRPPPATEAPPKEAAPTSSHGRGELILVVDDERSILEVTQQTLEAFGYRVLTAEDGTQAIGTFAQHRDEVALVITDMMMPVMDGPALITALRRLKPAVRIIAATGLNIKANVGRAGKIGVSHFLPKPFTAEILLDMVRRALDAKDSQTPF